MNHPDLYIKSLNLRDLSPAWPAIFRHEPQFFFLESSLQDPERGRYSFLGFDPFQVFASSSADALQKLRMEYGKYAKGLSSALTPLPCGIIGYLSYDYGLHELGLSPKPGDPRMPQCVFGFYDCILTIDHLARKLHISSSGLPEEDLTRRKKKAQSRCDDILEKLKRTAGVRETGRPVQLEDEPAAWRSNFSPEAFKAAVVRALDYIGRGDIYQVNLSQQFSLDRTALDRHPFDIYRSLCRLSPSSFGSYFDLGVLQIISSSPERFLTLSNGTLVTRPMKGTRPRGEDPKVNHRLKQELLSSAKDTAELLMITDLERNDLGRVCDFGSVRVTQMRAIEEYATVFQATSNIEGRLRKDKDAFDALQACFPGGSITGCPKRRAMEIIQELEGSPRNIYTGTLGYVSFSGEMDFSILIRTLLATVDKYYFQAGAGIVADSDPAQEYEETLVKAAALMACLREAKRQDPCRIN